MWAVSWLWGRQALVRRDRPGGRLANSGAGAQLGERRCEAEYAQDRRGLEGGAV